MLLFSKFYLVKIIRCIQLVLNLCVTTLICWYFSISAGTIQYQQIKHAQK